MQNQFKHTDFKDIYTHREGETLVICYRSGLFTFEEYLVGGRLVSGGFNGAGFPQNILEDLPTRLSAGEWADASVLGVEIDGTTLDFDLALGGFEKYTELRGAQEILHGILTLTSLLLPITVKIHTVLDGTPVMERWLEILNTGDAPHGISELAVFAGSVEEGTDRGTTFFDPADAKGLYTLGTMQSSMWGCEGLFHWQDLPDGALCVSGKYGRDRHRHPAFFLKNNLYGSLFFGQLAYAGGFELRFDKNTEPNAKTGCNCRLSWRFSLTGPKPLLVLGAGEGYASPAMHLGMVIGGLDNAVHAMHTHLRRSVITLPDARGVKGWVEAGMGPERTMDMTAVKHFADTAAAVGAEVLIIDAGWYCPIGTATREWGKRTGDWHPDRTLLPGGFDEVREYLHSKGLLFGLWMEAERIGGLSRIAADHPEFLAPSYITGKKGEFVDLTNPEALAFVEGEICRIIEEYKIDLFRLDHNTHAAAWFTKTVQHGRPACGLAKQVRIVEELFTRLRKKYPHVVFENCAAGGGRTDIGMVRNFTHTWVSDWNVAPRSVAVTNGMTMVLPPEMVDRLCSGMYCHTKGELALQVRHTLFGRPTTNDYNPIGSAENPEQVAFVKHTFDIYKQFIRPCVGKDRIFHHTEELNGTVPHGICILERAAEDMSRSTVGIFSLAGTGEREVRVFPRGIDGGAHYLVTMDNTGETAHVSGYSIKNEGIRVRLDSALQSELLLLQRKE